MFLSETITYVSNYGSDWGMNIRLKINNTVRIDYSNLTKNKLKPEPRNCPFANM